MNSAERLVSHAREGRFLEVLPDLLALAEAPGGRRDPVWQAAAASIQILLWRDDFTQAAQLAEGLMAKDGPRGGNLCDQDTPFDSALLAAEQYAAVPALPRLTSLTAGLPADRVLSRRLLWLSGRLPEQPVEELLPDHADWGGPAKSLDEVIGAHLVGQDYGALKPREKRLVWQALAESNDFERAHDLTESTGETPEQFAICTWMAGWYATEGDVERGERLLLAAHGRWWPYANWDAIPISPVLQPTLRLVATDRVRDHYLTRSIGPEAAE